MNALTQTKPRPQLGPSMDAPSSLSREFMSMMFLRIAAEYEELAAGTTGAGTRLIREQAQLAREYAADVRFEPVPRIVYVSLVGFRKGNASAGNYVYWRPGSPPLGEPLPWGLADQLAKIWVEGQNSEGANLHPKPIRFDPPVGL